MTPEDKNDTPEFLHGPPLSDQNRRKIIAICKKHMPPEHMEIFISSVEEMIDFMRGRFKSEQWQRENEVNLPDAKADKRKLKALSKAVNELSGTEAMEELSGEFRRRFLGVGLFARDLQGNRAGIATGESVLYLVKCIADELQTKESTRGPRENKLKQGFLFNLAADWEECSGKPPPITEHASFDKIAQLAWGEITGSGPAPSFKKQIELYICKGIK